MGAQQPVQHDWYAREAPMAHLLGYAGLNGPVRRVSGVRLGS